MEITSLKAQHCVKSVRIQSFSGPCFPAFGLNTEDTPYLSVFSPNAGKYGPEKLRIRKLFTQCGSWKDERKSKPKMAFRLTRLKYSCVSCYMRPKCFSRKRGSYPVSLFNLERQNHSDKWSVLHRFHFPWLKLTGVNTVIKLSFMCD